MGRGQHQISTGWSLLCGISAVMAVLVFFKLDVSLILRTVTLCLLILGSFTFFLYLVGDKLEAFWRQLFCRRQKNDDRKGSELSAEELTKQERAVRERIQKEYKEKASKYEAEVVRPRQDAKKVRLENEFYKFAGPAWKGKSHRLGGREDNDGANMTGQEKPSSRKRTKGTSKDASAVRKLPESVTRPSPILPEQPKQKRVIVLPDEPDSAENKCITVAMRGTQSIVKKRKFLYTEKVQVLLDWMTKQGYHPKLYTVCTTFPRRDLSQHVEETLEDIQLVRDVMLVIEERE